MLELPRHTFVCGNDIVERVGDLAGQPGLVTGQADGEVADPHRLKRLQQLVRVDRAAGQVVLRDIGLDEAAIGQAGGKVGWDTVLA